MTGAHRGYGRSRRRADRAQVDAASWLPAALADVAFTHEPDTARIRKRMAGAAGETSSSDTDGRGSHHILRSTDDSSPPTGRWSRSDRCGWLSRRRPAVIAVGMATGVLSITAITVIGVRAIPPRDERQAITAVAAPVQSTSASPRPPTTPPPPTASPPGGQQQTAPASAPSATTTATVTTPRTGISPSISTTPLLQLTQMTMPTQRIVLPLPNVMDWVLYGPGAGGAVRERARADLGNPAIGQLGIVGATPTAVTGMNGRFDWSGGRPQATGKDYIDRLAVPASGEIRLTISLTTGVDGHLDLYLGTIGVRGMIRTDLDGQAGPAMALAPPQPGRWVDAVVRINFRGIAGPHTLAVTVSTADGSGQPAQGFQRGGSGGTSPWQPAATSTGQISLAAAILINS